MNATRVPELPQSLPQRDIRPGTVLWRIHRSRHNALWFSPGKGRLPRYRFDDPEKRFSVCYLSTVEHGAFAETMLRTLPTRILSKADLATRRLTAIEVVRSLKLVQMYGAGLARLGCTAATATGQDYEGSREWSRALWMHDAKPDGILYHAAHDDETLSIALFNRARRNVRIAAHSSVRLDDAGLLKRFLDRYDLALLD